VAASIREARQGEEEELLPAYEWLFEPPAHRPRSWKPERAAAALAGAIRSAEACVLVAAADGQTVGLLTAYLDLDSVRFGRRCWVEDLAVDSAHRSRGIGKALLDAAKAWGRERGATHLELDSAETRTGAHRFYEREGADYRSISFGWEL
jgi:GNAT superfamily N-acetyltransferase